MNKELTNEEALQLLNMCLTYSNTHLDVDKLLADVITLLERKVAYTIEQLDKEVAF